PMRSEVERHDETAAGEEEVGDAGSPDPDAIVESAEDGRDDQAAASTEERGTDTDQEVTLANEFLPSAMGLTALLEVPDRLDVDVAAAIYLHEEFQWESRKDKNGKESFPKAWWRRPIDQTVEISSAELLGHATKVFEKPVVQENGRT